MITYAVKRCSAFGFAPSVEKAIQELESSTPDSGDKFSMKRCVYIGSDSVDSFKSVFDKNLVITDEVNPASFSSCKFVDFVIQLGEERKFSHRVPNRSTDDLKYLTEKYTSYNESPDAGVSADIKLESLRALISLYKDKDYLKEKEMDESFFKYVMEIYGDLKDSAFKLTLLEELKRGGINTYDLEEKHPLEFHDEEYTAVVNTRPFEDIQIVVDGKTSGSSGSIYKTSKEDMKQATLGNSTQLEAFSKGLFTVIRGRKSAGFNFENRLMNHDVLDMLAQNGVVCTPSGLKNNSFDKLMEVFEKCEHFRVMFVHPSLMSKSILTETPCEQSLPEYEMNEGEILAVAFRYMCINFFGYKGVYNREQKEYEYLF